LYHNWRVEAALCGHASLQVSLAISFSFQIDAGSQAPHSSTSASTFFPLRVRYRYRSLLSRYRYLLKSYSNHENPTGTLILDFPLVGKENCDNCCDGTEKSHSYQADRVAQISPHGRRSHAHFSCMDFHQPAARFGSSVKQQRENQEDCLINYCGRPVTKRLSCVV